MSKETKVKQRGGNGKGRSTHARTFRQRGAAAIEFGLIFPALVILLFGGLESGWALYTYSSLSHAIQEATRFAIVRGASSSSPATAGEIKIFLQGRVPKLTIPTANINVAFVPDNSPGSEVVIGINYDYEPLIPYVPLGKFTFKPETRMVIAQ